MTVTTAKNAGFCFGVKRAVEQAFNLQGENNYILGEIIHNESVVAKLNELVRIEEELPNPKMADL